MRSGKHGNGHKKTGRRQTTEGGLFGERSAAEHLGVSYITLFRVRQAGEIPFYRVGSRVLYDQKCLEEYKQRIRRPASAAA